MDRRYARLILNIVIPMVEILLLCLLGPKLLKFFMPFVIGWIIAMIANPLVRFLESRVKLVRKHSSVLIVFSGDGPKDYRHQRMVKDPPDRAWIYLPGLHVQLHFCLS